MLVDAIGSFSSSPLTGDRGTCKECQVHGRVPSVLPHCQMQTVQINGKKCEGEKSGDRISVWMNGSLVLIASGAQIERFPKSTEEGCG